MALHRDIYWVGRQWAVTGHGMQAIDQKLQGKFDIAVSRLWEDNLPESLGGEKWFNSEDFNKGLALARARYPLPPGQAPPAKKVLPAHTVPLAQKVPPASEVAHSPDAAPPLKSAARASDGIAAEAPRPVSQKFHIRIDGCPAKFVRPWRIRLARNGIAAEQDN